MMGRGSVLVICVLCALLSFASFAPPREEAPLNTPAALPAPPPADSLRTNLDDYIWPTDAGRIVTSTFGEFRRIHFHAGIDISTGDVTGYQVFASRDGYVSRISVNPNGYGKMLYVRHPDGYQTVYAHLQKFSPRIEQRAAREQQKQETYTIDLACDPQELPVRKGETIAYTGDTGIGSPHLHFEIRDEQSEGVNPLLCSHFETQDDIPPIVTGLAVVPIGEQSLVQGGWDTQVFRIQKAGDHMYRVPEPIRVTGRAGFAIKARDRTNNTAFDRGVYRYRVYLDDQLFSSVVLYRAPAVEMQRIGLYYDWDLLDNGRGRFERLFNDSTGILPFFGRDGRGAGRISSEAFGEGAHTFTIICSDINGNDAEVHGNIIFNHPPSFTLEPQRANLIVKFDDAKKVHEVHLSSRYNGSSSWNTHTVTPEPLPGTEALEVALPSGNADVFRVVAENAFGSRSRPQFFFSHKPFGPPSTLTVEHQMGEDFVRVLLKTGGAFTAQPRLTVTEGTVTRTVPTTAVDIDLYEGTFRPLLGYAGSRKLVAEAEINGRPTTSLDVFDLYPIVPGTTGSINLDGGRLRIAYDSLASYKPVLMEVEKEQDSDGTRYYLLPERALLRSGLTVAVRLETATGHDGLYFRGRGTNELIATHPDGSGKYLEGRIRRTLGELEILSDTTPPYVTSLSVTTSARKPRFSFRYGDNLSGIEYHELKTYIDGKIVIPEIDGEHRRVLYQASDPLERGTHQLMVRLKDRAGNTSNVARRFLVR